MTSPLLRLFPARWRTRYGDEFEALLAERPLGPFDVADVLLAASTPISTGTDSGPFRTPPEGSPCRFASEASPQSPAASSG